MTPKTFPKWILYGPHFYPLSNLLNVFMRDRAEVEQPLMSSRRILNTPIRDNTV